ncbi:hypothetical protein CEXT_766101 [Caerostris extrusa]|uniref:Uncharacterized protein n=1 Tax=Caerostris extrusa TaxID=172846 RepID=A0AAV4NKE3_CAEEX|nr:hypothetical protein CEXT_766101 [Caerostris extrusa]
MPRQKGFSSVSQHPAGVTFLRHHHSLRNDLSATENAVKPMVLPSKCANFSDIKANYMVRRRLMTPVHWATCCLVEHFLRASGPNSLTLGIRGLPGAQFKVTRALLRTRTGVKRGSVKV